MKKIFIILIQIQKQIDKNSINLKQEIILEFEHFKFQNYVQCSKVKNDYIEYIKQGIVWE